MKSEPTRLEIFLTRIALLLCGKSVYKAFADRLMLVGNENVADFGCGMGTVAYYVAKRLTEGHLTCIDISERWLNACRKNLRSYNNVSFQKSELNLLKRESFDLVYCHFVLHDIENADLDNVIPTLAQSLKEDGLLVYREPLSEAEKLSFIKRLVEKSGLIYKESRITDVPILGNALESVFVKK